jgi:hypothetical protein
MVKELAVKGIWDKKAELPWIKIIEIAIDVIEGFKYMQQENHISRY